MSGPDVDALVADVKVGLDYLWGDEAKENSAYAALDELVALARDTAAELRAERLEAALRDLLDNIGGHDHWDSTMQHGAGCETCIRQREAKARARAALGEQP